MDELESILETANAKLESLGKVIPGKTKRCNRCLQVKPLDDFYKRKGDWKSRADRFGCLSKCKECAKLKTREYWSRYKKAPIAACHICGNVELLVKDHCHATGMNRGMLCQGCNKGLGYFKDNPERLIKAAEYLKRYGAV